jgi:F-type H+-transporting ATPase subunit delta
MKITKDANRAARQLLRACVDASGRLHGSRAKTVIKKLAETKPRNYLSIAVAFERLVRLEVQKRRATIESAAVLSPELRDQLRADLQKKFGEDLELDFNINPELLGGLRVQVGSQVWDGSVRAKLETLRSRLA